MQKTENDVEQRANYLFAPTMGGQTILHKQFFPKEGMEKRGWKKKRLRFVCFCVPRLPLQHCDFAHLHQQRQLLTWHMLRLIH